MLEGVAGWPREGDRAGGRGRLAEGERMDVVRHGLAEGGVMEVGGCGLAYE